jgi:methylmalonyl-CoA/ethylmalonyl-CoA epimerase
MSLLIEKQEATVSALEPAREATVNIAQLGPIMQIAHVVDDLDEAIRTWAKAMSVGPFFLRRHVSYASFDFEGRPCPVDISLAFAYSGDLQIELIQQHNAIPSLYVDGTGAPAAGIHHVGICTTDLEADEAKLAASGFHTVARALSETGTLTVYLKGPAPCLVELIRLGDNGAFFRRIKQAAEAWDGVSPVAE